MYIRPLSGVYIKKHGIYRLEKLYYSHYLQVFANIHPQDELTNIIIKGPLVSTQTNYNTAGEQSAWLQHPG